MEATLIITQCAWCGAIRIRGHYRMLGNKSLVHEIDLPLENGRLAHYSVSHGICRPCVEKMNQWAIRGSAVRTTVSSARADRVALKKKPYEGRLAA